MHKLIEYIDDEIMSIEKKAGNGKLSMQELQYVDTLAHAKKNLLKADEMEGGDDYSNAYNDAGYSNRRYSRRGYSREDGASYDGGSYARGRGPYAARDRFGRYSSADGYSMRSEDMVDELRELMERAPEDKKQDFQRFIAKIERM